MWVETIGKQKIMQIFNKKKIQKESKYSMWLSNKQYLIIMKMSITDFKIGMLQRGKVRSKEEMKALYSQHIGG